MYYWGVEYNFNELDWQKLLFHIDRSIIQNPSWGIIGNEAFLSKMSNDNGLILRRIFAPFKELKKIDSIECLSIHLKTVVLKKVQNHGINIKFQVFHWDWDIHFFKNKFEYEIGQFTKL